MTEPDKIVLTWIPLISAAIALAAVLFGPLVNAWVARRQTAIQVAIAYRAVISPMRQKWINDLRERLAEFSTVAAWFYLNWYRVGEPKNKAEEKEKALRLILLRNQIELMLNPAEEDHQHLLKLLEEVRRTSQESEHTDEYPKAVVDTNACCKKILKAEWERVKREQAAPPPKK